MKNKILSGAVLIGFLMIFASCAKDDFTSPQSNDLQEFTENGIATDRGPTVPFKAEVLNIPVVTNIDDAGNLFEDINGTGKATHLGKCTWFSETVVYGAIEDPVTFTLRDDDPWIQEGTMTFTAADGSELCGWYKGTTEFQEENFSFVGDGEFWIDPDVLDPEFADDSGLVYEPDCSTKRFVGTSGYGTYSYVASPNEDGELTAILKFTGTLTKP